jgi:uncharacterized membrane protein
MAEEEKKPALAPSSGGQKNIGMAVLCYFGILVLIPFLTDAKNDPFVKFHIKQGLVLLISYVIVGVITAIPFLGWIVGGILWILLLILFIMGIINAAGGKEVELPVIGKFGENFKI